MAKEEYKVWVAVSKRALKNNLAILRRKKKAETKLWAVVKSNAYGHGLFLISPFLEKSGVDGFCVDSVKEGARLRKEKVRKPILVMGPTLSRWLPMAAENKISITISSWEFLKRYAAAVRKFKQKPLFHLKIDTGMHRQGFFPSEVSKVLNFIREHQLPLSGVYTHFADSPNSDSYTEKQFKAFFSVRELVRRAGFKKIIFHCANSAAFLRRQRYHLDAVRIGNALYGLAPSVQWQRQFKRLGLVPALQWKAHISEVKTIPKGEGIGYGLMAKTKRPTKLALIPIGFWHGYPWSLWDRGEVLVKGRRVNILGRISMDMMAADVTGLPVRVHNVATLIGTDKKESIWAQELAAQLGVRPQEIVTRINPLIHRELE